MGFAYNVSYTPAGSSKPTKNSVGAGGFCRNAADPPTYGFTDFTRLNLGSVSKYFTAVAIMKVFGVENGNAAALDTDFFPIIAPHLTGLKDCRNQDYFRGITVRLLLEMRVSSPSRVPELPDSFLNYDFNAHSLLLERSFHPCRLELDRSVLHGFQR